MNIAVDIGNTRVKCGVFFSGKVGETRFLRIPPKGKEFSELTTGCPGPITWQIAQTGSFSWQELKAEILKIRPRDKFKIVTRRQIPLEIDVDFPQKVGIDRLLAAFAATEKYGDSPMLVVDAGSAITIDVVRDRTFCGGAILPGLVALSETYPKISEKLPLVRMPCEAPPIYPGRNTKDAVHSGLYWGTIGAIRQFYEKVCTDKKNVLLILTGGDAPCLLRGLSQVIPARRTKHHEFLVLEGINRCFSE